MFPHYSEPMTEEDRKAYFAQLEDPKEIARRLESKRQRNKVKVSKESKTIADQR